MVRSMSNMVVMLVKRQPTVVGAFAVLLSLCTVGYLIFGSDTGVTIDRMRLEGLPTIKAATWNMAAINNNPFEYWITYDDQTYNDLMQKISDFIVNPGEEDVAVSQVFSEAMFAELKEQMSVSGWDKKGGSGELGAVAEVEKLWRENYRYRKIISGFIQDGILGKKRLASMPDRVTNTVVDVNGATIFRPTVINCYEGSLSTQEEWWKAWKEFMFETQVEVKDRKGGVVRKKISSMLGPIRHSKYPSITPEEEAISLPLQALCGAIFDAILVHMMKVLASKQWQPLRKTMCERLNRKKNDRVLQILSKEYGRDDVIFLQEVASSFIPKATLSPVAEEFEIRAPGRIDTSRDQNSLLLLRKGLFSSIKEVSEAVIAFGEAQVPNFHVEAGDLFCLVADRVGMAERPGHLLCSFHGDTDGVCTLPVVEAVKKYALEAYPRHQLLFGLDANVYEKPAKGQQSHAGFVASYLEHNLNSCYGEEPAANNYTTFHARTFLQPQLNKAVTAADRDRKGDKNPKDAILFHRNDFAVLRTKKDNTGSRDFTEGMVFPTLDFPSDHGITSTVLAYTGAV